MEVLRRSPVLRRLTESGPAHEFALPPRVPDELLELEEAMALLGAYVQVSGKLRSSRLERLKALIGALPSLADAKAWKSGLKELRSEIAELETRAGGQHDEAHG